MGGICWAEYTGFQRVGLSNTKYWKARLALQVAQRFLPLQLPRLGFLGSQLF